MNKNIIRDSTGSLGGSTVSNFLKKIYFIFHESFRYFLVKLDMKTEKKPASKKANIYNIVKKKKM